MYFCSVGLKGAFDILGFLNSVPIVHLGGQIGRSKMRGFDL